MLMESIVAVEVLRVKELTKNSERKKKKKEKRRAVIIPRIPNIGIMLALNGLKIGKTQSG